MCKKETEGGSYCRLRLEIHRFHLSLDFFIGIGLRQVVAYQVGKIVGRPLAHIGGDHAEEIGLDLLLDGLRVFLAHEPFRHPEFPRISIPSFKGTFLLALVKAAQSSVIHCLPRFKNSFCTIAASCS